LRFPGFGGEWEREKLRDKCSFYSGGTPSSSNKSYYNGEIPFIRSGEISGDSTELFLSEFGLNNSSAKMVDIGDLLLALYGATSGQIAISKIRGAINQAILCIKSSYDNIFLKSVWEKHVDKILQAYLQGGQGNLSADIVKNLSFYFPSLDEQNKISKLIVLIDERIETQNKIIEQLQSLIKGIVVSITAETPNARIDKCLVCHSSTLQENNIEDFGDFPVYGANGICGYTVNADFNEPAILIVKDGSGVGNVRFVNGRYSVIGTQNILTPQNEICLKYIFYCLQAFNFVPYKTGMAIPHIYFKDYGKAKIYCPNFEQQVKIASQIDLIESKIEIATQLLNKYEEQKKFLLSNMFI